MIWFFIVWWIGWAFYGHIAGGWRDLSDFIVRPALMLGLFTIFPIGGAIAWIIWKLAYLVELVIKSKK